MAIEANLTVTRRRDGHNEIEQRGLACTVWAHDAEGLALSNREVQIVDRGERAEMFGEMANFEQCGVHQNPNRAVRSFAQRISSRPPHSPAGRKRMTRIRIRPVIIR